MTENQRQGPAFTWSNDRTVRTKRYHKYLGDIEVTVDAEQVDGKPATFFMLAKAKHSRPATAQLPLTSAQILEMFQVVTLMMADFEAEAPES